MKTGTTQVYIKVVEQMPLHPLDQVVVFSVVMFSYYNDAYWTGDTWSSDSSKAFPFKTYQEADDFYASIGRPSLGAIFRLIGPTDRLDRKYPKFWVVDDEPTFESWDAPLVPPRTQFRFKGLWQWLNKPRFSYSVIILAIILESIINVWWP